MEKEIVIKVHGQYLGEDYASGGYPYRSSLKDAKGFKSTSDAWKWLGSLKTNYPEARLVYRVVDIKEID